MLASADEEGKCMMVRAPMYGPLKAEMFANGFRSILYIMPAYESHATAPHNPSTVHQFPSLQDTKTLKGVRRSCFFLLQYHPCTAQYDSEVRFAAPLRPGRDPKNCGGSRLEQYRMA